MTWTVDNGLIGHRCSPSSSLSFTFHLGCSIGKHSLVLGQCSNGMKWSQCPEMTLSHQKAHGHAPQNEFTCVPECFSEGCFSQQKSKSWTCVADDGFIVNSCDHFWHPKVITQPRSHNGTLWLSSGPSEGCVWFDIQSS